MEEYEHEQLDKMLQIFYTEIRTKDGCEYEPESLKSMLAALDRYLKEHDYKYSIIRDREFHQSKLVLEGKVKCLRQQGKGKRPNAANALTAEEEKMLWSEQSLGDCSPILRTFKTSLVPINHEMHSRSYDFLYVLLCFYSFVVVFTSSLTRFFFFFRK